MDAEADLLVLARPRWRDWWIFTAGELVYFVAIWWHLSGALSPGDSSGNAVYQLAVLLRLATEAWVVAMVVRDALPEPCAQAERPRFHAWESDWLTHVDKCHSCDLQRACMGIPKPYLALFGDAEFVPIRRQPGSAAVGAATSPPVGA